MNFDARNETARGYLLLGVFFIHILYDMTGSVADASEAPVSLALLKLLAPQISMFFFLSGLSSRGIGKRSFRSILPQSFMLLFLSWVSHAVGFAAQVLLFGGEAGIIPFMKDFAKPIIYGTGGVTYVTWFFTVLAVTRILVWLFERNKPMFILTWAMIAAIIYAAKALHLPDNLYEWRNWPTATLFMLIGMRIPKTLQVSSFAGLSALAGAIVLTWFNQPELFSTFPCLTCNIEFVAEPMVGSYGVLPVYLIEQTLFFVFMLWMAQATLPTISGRIGSYFGRASLQLLLLHGWVLVTMEDYVANYFPARENLLLILAAFVLNPLLYAGLFRVLETPLNKILAFCFEAGRLATSIMFPSIAESLPKHS